MAVRHCSRGAKLNWQDLRELPALNAQKARAGGSPAKVLRRRARNVRCGTLVGRLADV